MLYSNTVKLTVTELTSASIRTVVSETVMKCRVHTAGGNITLSTGTRYITVPGSSICLVSYSQNENKLVVEALIDGRVYHALAEGDKDTLENLYDKVCMFLD